MPLVILTGYPSSGKTRLAQKLQQAFKEKINLDKSSFQVELVNDESLHIEKQAYKESRTEKSARAALYSSVERSLSRNTILICDGLNYIKGFRYQLFCVAKNMSTPHCVIHTGVPKDLCRQWNTDRGTEGYSDELFDELVNRFEEPNSSARWDSPLFTVIHDDVDLPIEKIWDSLNNVKVKPNFATMHRDAKEPDYLAHLEGSTQAIANAIIQAQKDGLSGELVLAESTMPIQLPIETVGLPKIQRLRRQFVNLSRVHTGDKTRIRDSFIEYLNAEL